MRIAVLGAGGVIGAPLMTMLIEAGHVVRAGVRSPQSLYALREIGVDAVACDILDIVTLGPLLQGCDAVINIATSIPKPGGRGDWALNDRIRTEGTRNLIVACLSAGVPRVVQQSVAMLLCTDDSRAQTELDAIEGYGRVATCVQLEADLMESTLDWRIVRGGLFYGAGREAGWKQQLDDPAFRIPAQGRNWLSQVHVRDYASALAHIVTLDTSRRIYNAVDDAPLTEGELYAAAAHWRGKPVPPLGDTPGLMRSFRVSNAKLRASGWLPQYPTLQQGLAALT